MTTTRRAFRVALLAAALTMGLAACATGDGADPSGPGDGTGDESAGGNAPVRDVVTARTASAEQDAEFGRLLQSVDKRADQYLLLDGQPGEDSRNQREIDRSALEAVLVQHGDRFLGALADRSEPTRRRIAAKAFAFSTDRRATPLLVAALGDAGDAQLRTNAALALARLRDPDTSIAALLAGARDADGDVRSNSLLALWHVLDARTDAGRAMDAATRDQVLPVLENSLFDPADPMVRAFSAASMGALGDPRSVDPLLNLLRDKHPGVRTHVALALGKLGDRRAIGPLVEQIGDSQKGMPRSAVILGISLLLEREGVTIPPDMPEDEQAWSGFVQRSLPPKR